jgi:hypothetical protein
MRRRKRLNPAQMQKRMVRAKHFRELLSAVNSYWFAYEAIASADTVIRRSRTGFSGPRTASGPSGEA